MKSCVTSNNINRIFYICAGDKTIVIAIDIAIIVRILTIISDAGLIAFDIPIIISAVICSTTVIIFYVNYIESITKTTFITLLVTFVATFFTSEF